MKRLFDIAVAGILLLVLWPVMVVICIVILLDSVGPVVFRQKRVGKNGKVFWIYKFRTMVKNAEKMQSRYNKLNQSCQPMFKIRNDPRFTRFGKVISWTGLDELPQLLNVLKGEMSMVGPRPLPVKEEKKLEKGFQKIRRSVLPGISSLWIVKGGHNLSYRQWVKLDKQYIDSISLKTDVEILYQTARIIVCQLIGN